MYEGQATQPVLNGLNGGSNRYEEATLAVLDGLRAETRQNSEIMCQLLEELKGIKANTTQSNPSQIPSAITADGATGSLHKEVGAAYAVVAVFIASIDVGLLTYSHEVFADRPEGSPARTSDSVISAFWFLSIIFAGTATMQFAVMQVFSYPFQVVRSRTEENAVDVDDDVEKERRVDIESNSIDSAGTREPGISPRPANPIYRARQHSSALHSSAIGTMVLLSISASNLFIGIIVFVWAEQTKSVAILVTACLGLAWVVPKIPPSIFCR